MTVRISREIRVPAAPERVWEFIADPNNRAAAISIVRDWEATDDGGMVWHVELPIPLIDRTIRVETHDRERQPPERVSFVGRSKVFRVTGEHELDGGTDETRLTNRFMVDGKVPGVERFFERRLDDELDNLEAALREWLDHQNEIDENEGVDRQDAIEGQRTGDEQGANEGQRTDDGRGETDRRDGSVARSAEEDSGADS